MCVSPRGAGDGGDRPGSCGTTQQNAHAEDVGEGVLPNHDSLSRRYTYAPAVTRGIRTRVCGVTACRRRLLARSRVSPRRRTDQSSPAYGPVSHYPQIAAGEAQVGGANVRLEAGRAPIRLRGSVADFGRAPLRRSTSRSLSWPSQSREGVGVGATLATRQRGRRRWPLLLPQRGGRCEVHKPTEVGADESSPMRIPSRHDRAAVSPTGHRVMSHPSPTPTAQPKSTAASQALVTSRQMTSSTRTAKPMARRASRVENQAGPCAPRRTCSAA